MGFLWLVREETASVVTDSFSHTHSHTHIKGLVYCMNVYM